MRRRSSVAILIALLVTVCFGIVIVVRKPDVANEAEQRPSVDVAVPVPERLDEIIEWTTANDDNTAIQRVIDCLSDEREIKGEILQGPAQETWNLLRSRTNVEISVRAFAQHYLCENPDRSKRLLADRIHELDQSSDADRTADWSPEDGTHVIRLLQALAEVHQSELLEHDVIPGTQVVIEIESQTGITRSSVAVIVGYVDHRDQNFSVFLSGDRISVTRRNIVALANAIRDSNIEDGSP